MISDERIRNMKGWYSSVEEAKELTTLEVCEDVMDLLEEREQLLSEIAALSSEKKQLVAIAEEAQVLFGNLYSIRGKDLFPSAATKTMVQVEREDPIVKALKAWRESE